MVGDSLQHAAWGMSLLRDFSGGDRRRLLCTVAQAQVGDAKIRVARQLPEQFGIVIGEAFDRRGIEALGRIDDVQPRAVIVFDDVERQVELRGARFDFARRDAQTRQRQQRRAIAALHAEHRVKERRVVGARSLQRPDQTREWQRTMRLRVEQRLACLREQRAERQIARHLLTHYQRVDEKADQVFGFDTVASARRYADAQIALAAVPV
ncbi:hypothetical protein R69746_08390 [Paraburkholderia aspalathi]|nr:hypothetical protein R69746_08390 [Paraburkholderia aspalathi]